jgi:hypothetical protein
LNEFDCCHGMKLNYTLSFSDVRSMTKYFTDRAVIVDDVKCFDQFRNLKTFVQSVQNSEDFKVRQLVTIGLNAFRRVVTLTTILSCLKHQNF